MELAEHSIFVPGYLVTIGLCNGWPEMIFFHSCQDGHHPKRILARSHDFVECLVTSKQVIAVTIVTIVVILSVKLVGSLPSLCNSDK